ncbi:hypothetical protein [Ferribacterium limneticum]|uniref:hypothetical protein n=1 Tax=Ferribacterium limneticum TaxID=76259 RepID=UPI001CFB2FE7|nr:hypothetical protein [Ferribacterium limneticum]UCV18974.1 hypothetical protein KI610_19690 [Ferribacterium limneticum]
MSLIDAMVKPPPLTDLQKARLGILEPGLRAAVYSADYKRAKAVAADIQSVLRSTGHETRLMRSKTWLFEAALNAGELLTAEAGFRGIRAKTAMSTKVHLEATALLVVCLLRQKKISEAEPLIEKVLKGKTIKDAARRRQFIENVTARYQLESYISAVKDCAYETLIPDAVDADAIEAVKTKTDEELYAQIASALPREVLEFVYRVDRAARKQLTMVEILYLPSPVHTQQKIEQGRSFFASLKLVIWKSLCDPQSEIYKAWYTNGMAQVLSKKYYAIVVSAALVDLGFAVKAVAVPATALLMKLGIEVYCERYKPGEILDVRDGKA